MKNIANENYINFQLEKALIMETERVYLFKLEYALDELFERLISKNAQITIR